MMNNLAALYNEQGQYGEGSPLYVQCLKNRTSILGENHPDSTLRESMIDLAALYDMEGEGKYDKEQPLHEECLLEEGQSILSENHVDSLQSVQVGQFKLLSFQEEQEPSRAPLLRSQAEVQTRFIPLLKKEGNVCRKNVTSFIRRGVKGEKIVTTVDGVHETENKVKDDNSWVVCGRAAGEYYVLSGNDFEECYDESSAKPIIQERCNPMTQRLHQQGFLDYRSKRQVWARKVDEHDMDFFRYCEKGSILAEAYFVAPWGESMRVEQGDYLVMQYPEGNDEVYRVERSVFGYSYTDSSNDA